ncbi:MAG: DNA repair protein RecO [Bacteroidetes bacterium]|jgi:DNA repair protein RecO (recombination protein O)|nr:DNA repair protein RecO [Bacteroidota bacterium]
MLCKSKAIVLHQIPYSENNNIIHFYTEKHGRLACMVKRPRTRKSQQHASFYQALNQLHIEYYYKNNRQIQILKESSLAGNIHFQSYHYARSGVIMFIAEILYRVIREEEKNDALFQYLENTLAILINNDFSPNFHLVFLLGLTKYLGIYPQNNFTGHISYFDVAAGNFKPFMNGVSLLSEQESRYIHVLLSLNFENMDEVGLSGEWRSQLLHILLRYLNYHLEGLGEIKSMKVMKELFL